MSGIRRFALFLLFCVGAAGLGYLLWAVQSGTLLSLLTSDSQGAGAPVRAEGPPARSASAGASGMKPLRLAVFYPGPIDPARVRDPAYVRHFAEIVRHFDLVAVHGFRGPGRGPFLPLLEAVSTGERSYQSLVFVPPRGPEVRQFPIVFYDPETLLVDKTRAGPIEDPNRLFRWTPIVISCAAKKPDLSEAFTFTAVIARVDPLRIPNELALLADLMRVVLYQHAPEDDVLLLAHLEATEDAVAEAFPEYLAAVTGVPNSAAGTRLASNILFHPMATCEFTGRSGVLSVDEILQGADRRVLEPLHFLPVWAEFLPIETPFDRFTTAIFDISVF